MDEDHVRIRRVVHVAVDRRGQGTLVVSYAKYRGDRLVCDGLLQVHHHSLCLGLVCGRGRLQPTNDSVDLRVIPVRQVEVGRVRRVIEVDEP